MVHKRALSGIRRLRYAAIALSVIFAVLMLAGCSSQSGAEKRVKTELNALKASDHIGSGLSGLRESLSDSGKDDFDSFIKKVKSFNYEITGSRDSDDSGSSGAVVTVKISAYGFGSEYLATWTDYIKDRGDVLLSDEDTTAFYESLFARLAALDEKDCINSVEITCIDPLGNGEWVADIKDNELLQDAIFGGMIGEMTSLAADQ